MDVMVFYKSRLSFKGKVYGQLLVTTGLDHRRLKLLVVNWAAQLITFKTRMLPCKNLMHYVFIFTNACTLQKNLTKSNQGIWPHL